MQMISQEMLTSAVYTHSTDKRCVEMVTLQEHEK